MGKTRDTGKLATQIQFDNNNNLIIGSSPSSILDISGSIEALTITGSFTGSVYGIGDVVSFSASINSDLNSIHNTTSSNITKITNLENKTGSLASTGSNTFYGTQTFSGSVYIANNLIVQGSSSIQYITGSSVSIGTNIVSLNTAFPSVRYAGLSIVDSGSIGGSGSFLYDSVQDEFLFVHRGDGTNVTSSHFVLGPETYNNLGNETYLTCNKLSKGTGKEHLVDSNIFDDGTTICLGGNTKINSSGIGCFASSVCVGGGLVAQAASTFCNTVAVFGNTPELYIGGSSAFADYTIQSWCSTCKYLNIRHQSISNTPGIVLACGGNIGIGTCYPMAQLHVRTSVLSANRPTNLATSATNSAVYFTTIDGSNAGIAFGQISSNTNYIQGTYQDGSSATPFAINPYGGCVGINMGNTNPSYPLEIVHGTGYGFKISTNDATSANNSGIMFYNEASATAATRRSYILLDPNGANGTGGDYTYLDMFGSGNATLMNQLSTGNLILGTAGTTRVFVCSNGNVGIGTDKSCSKFIVDNNAAPNSSGWINTGTQFASSMAAGLASLNVGAYDDGGTNRYDWIRTAFSDNAAIASELRIYTGITERIRVTGGCIGINNSCPRASLEINQACSDANYGGFMFKTMDLPDNTWVSFFTPPANWAGLTTFNWVGTNDHNRSGAAQIRWSYQNCSAALGPTTTIFNDSQNAQPCWRYSGGDLQMYVNGAGAGKRLQIMIMGSRGA